MRTLIIHNTSSGFGSDAIFEFERMLLADGGECVVRILQGELKAKDLASDANDFDLVVISGGDGTISNVLYELKGSPTKVCLFPSGTANLLNANLGISSEPAALALACKNAVSVPIDLGLISWENAVGEREERAVSLMAGIGFDAQLMKSALRTKAQMGQAAYFAAAFENREPKVEHFIIEADGQSYEYDGIACIVANTAMIQGDIEIIPNARMDDGLLDVIVLETKDALQLLRPLFAGLIDPKGRALGRPHVRSLQAKEITVTASSELPVEVDGEPISDLTRSYHAQVMPYAINLIVDAMSPYYPKR